MVPRGGIAETRLEKYRCGAYTHAHTFTGRFGCGSSAEELIHGVYRRDGGIITTLSPLPATPYVSISHFLYIFRSPIIYNSFKYTSSCFHEDCFSLTRPDKFAFLRIFA